MAKPSSGCGSPCATAGSATGCSPAATRRWWTPPARPGTRSSPSPGGCARSPVSPGSRQRSALREPGIRLYELLLRYNHRSAETGGARMALDGEGGAAVLLLDLVAGSTLTCPGCRRRLRDSAARARAEIVARGPGGDDGAELPFNPPLMGMIRDYRGRAEETMSAMNVTA